MAACSAARYTPTASAGAAVLHQLREALSGRVLGTAFPWRGNDFVDGDHPQWKDDARAGVALRTTSAASYSCSGW